jgi:hypothetical protein
MDIVVHLDTAILGLYVQTVQLAISRAIKKTSVHRF